MKKMGVILISISMFVIHVCTLSVKADVLYQDDFNSDTLAGNDGIGGGGANKVLYAGQNWLDNGDLWLSRNNENSGANYQAGTLFYSTNAFQSTGGFKLGVLFTHTSKGAGEAGDRFGLGLISDATDLSALSGANLSIFGNGAGYYSLGAYLTGAGGTEGLNFSDGTSSTNLDSNTISMASSPSSIVIDIDPGGIWSYSVGGVEAASGTIASGFDLTTNYHVVVCSQDDQTIKTVHELVLNEGDNLAPFGFEQDTIITLPDTAANITLSGIDYEGTNITFNVESQPLHGLLVTNVALPDLTYTPTNGYQGADSFTFTVNDGETNSALVAISLMVTNQLPIANAQSVQTLPNTATNITLAGSDTDGPSNLTFTVESQPVHGTLVTNGALPDLIYTPTNGYQGADSFTFTVNDGMADSALATVSITVTNELPTVETISMNAIMDTPRVVTLIGNNADGPSNLTYSVVLQPTKGELSGTSSNLVYTPDRGYIGPDSFTYTANDGLVESSPSTVKITVLPVGTTVQFVNLNASLNANTVMVDGTNSNVTVSGVASGNDYVYSVTYTGADYDGDAANDTVMFDVRVKGWSGSITDVPHEEENSSVNTASATIGTNSSAVTIASGARFSVGGNMADGETLEFILENMVVSLTDPAQDGSVTPSGFYSARLEETGGNSHQTVFGEGTELLGWDWNGPPQESGGFNVGAGPLYVSSDAPAAGFSHAAWGVDNVDFRIIVSAAPFEGTVLLVR